MNVRDAKAAYDDAEIALTKHKNMVSELSEKLSDPRRSSMPQEYYDALYAFQQKRKETERLYDVYLALKEKFKNKNINDPAAYFLSKTKEKELTVTCGTHERWKKMISSRIDLLFKNR